VEKINIELQNMGITGFQNEDISNNRDEDKSGSNTNGTQNLLMGSTNQAIEMSLRKPP